MAVTLQNFVDGIFNNTLRFIINKKRYVTEHTEGAEVLSLIFSVVGLKYSGLRYLRGIETSLNADSSKSNANLREYQNSYSRPFACNSRIFALKLFLSVFHLTGVLPVQKACFVRCKHATVLFRIERQKVIGHDR